ncbi:MAG: nickel insertion protein, partial [Thermovirgaceae bacterium]
MKRVLYLNCFSGISGDMLLGALLDLQGERDLQPYIRGLDLEGFHVVVERSGRKGITGLDVKVVAKEGHPHRRLPEIEEIINRSSLSLLVKEKALQAFNLLAEAEGAVHGKSPREVHFHEVG